MDNSISKDSKVSKEEITTIKLSKGTKERLDHLRIHPRETYEEIMQSHSISEELMPRIKRLYIDYAAKSSPKGYRSKAESELKKRL